MCRSSILPSEPAVDDDVLVPIDLALDDAPPPYRGDTLGSVRSAGAMSARRWWTTDRSIVSKLRLDHCDVTFDSSRGPGTVHAPSSAPASSSRTTCPVRYDVSRTSPQA